MWKWCWCRFQVSCNPELNCHIRTMCCLCLISVDVPNAYMHFLNMLVCCWVGQPTHTHTPHISNSSAYLQICKDTFWKFLLIVLALGLSPPFSRDLEWEDKLLLGAAIYIHTKSYTLPQEELASRTRKSSSEALVEPQCPLLCWRQLSLKQPGPF